VSYSDVLPLNWSRSTIYSVAGQLREKLLPSPSNEIEAAIGFLGGQVLYHGLSETNAKSDGSILIDGEGDFKVFIPDYVSRERNRFTLAHELGHYLLHYLVPGRGAEKVKAARAATRSDDRAEWEANWFAAGFLMPEAEFREAFGELDGDLIGVARRFGVSVPAAKVHARFHGIQF
jgi:Zn-dependent peptidase ImmA (M78 family)